MAYVFITGGASSGKSRFALDWFKGRSRVAFVATGLSTDPEMEERIRAHRRERPSGWTTIEERFDIIGATRSVPPGSDGLIVDCITFWVSNLIYGKGLEQAAVRSLAEETAGFLARLQTPAVVVTNEIGLGVIPATGEGRAFRKVAGEVNQIFAALSDEAYMVVSGIGMKIK